VLKKLKPRLTLSLGPSLARSNAHFLLLSATPKHTTRRHQPLHALPRLQRHIPYPIISYACLSVSETSSTWYALLCATHSLTSVLRPLLKMRTDGVHNHQADSLSEEQVSEFREAFSLFVSRPLWL